jgi:hypothetical protein
MTSVYTGYWCGRGHVSRRSKPASLALTVLPRLSSLACWRPVSRLTSTFQGQLFHRPGASPGSYGPTTCRPPVRPAGLRAMLFRPFHQRASWRTRLSCLHGSSWQRRLDDERCAEVQDLCPSDGYNHCLAPWLWKELGASGPLTRPQVQDSRTGSRGSEGLFRPDLPGFRCRQ